MAFKKGDTVRVTSHHAAVPAGTHGKVISTHTGPYSKVWFGGGLAVIPHTELEPAEDEAPGSPEAKNEGDALSSWERAMAFFKTKT